jgi:hypothetical protein
MASGTLLEAPADRPAGQRGRRAWLACAAAVAAVPPLATSSVAGGADRALDLFATAALIAAAVLIWTARRPRGLVLAGVLAALAVAAAVTAGFDNRYQAVGSNRWGEMSYAYDPDGTAVTPSQARAVPAGATEDEVTELLGSPAGEGTQQRRDGSDARCILYREEPSRGRYEWQLAFCFPGGTYRSLQRW